MTHISIQALEALVDILPEGSTPSQMVGIAKWAALEIEAASAVHISEILFGELDETDADDAEADRPVPAPAEAPVAAPIAAAANISAPVAPEAAEISLPKLDASILDHWESLGKSDEWTLSADVYLLSKVIEGWKIGEIATDLDVSGDKVKKRFDALIGRSFPTSKDTRFSRDDVCRVLRAKLAEGGAK